jgi:NAD(P)-dependent dehydrogenase (short-subunit alcohol dehydrogenase family)
MKSNALITGAASGIGLATVRIFLETGWEVYAADLRATDQLPEEVQFIRCDVSQEDSVVELFTWLGERIQDLHALVNNAGIQISKPLLDVTADEWDQTLATNLRSVFLMSKAAHPFLRAAKGAIVNVSSVHAVATSINIAAYAASKGGISALTRAMALEFGPDQIRANAILPGAVDTEMLRSGLDRGHLDGTSIEERLDQLGQKTVIGRVGHPEEIARGILFLADSQQSGFMTGEMMVVDGGALARLSTE